MEYSFFFYLSKGCEYFLKTECPTDWLTAGRGGLNVAEMTLQEIRKWNIMQTVKKEEEIYGYFGC